MEKETFETTTRRREGESRSLSTGFFARCKMQILVCTFVVSVLLGGAYYSSRASEGTPKVVYSTALDEARYEAQAPLLVDINTADARELDELPGVGPATAEAIIEHRRHQGKFRSVDELDNVKGIGPKTLEKIKPFAKV